MRFKDFEIRKCTFIGDPPTPDYHKWNFDVVKWGKNNDGKEYCWSIGHLEWDRNEYGFKFRSVGVRYLQYREDGLEEWLLKWCEMKEVEYMYEEDAGW